MLLCIFDYNNQFKLSLQLFLMADVFSKMRYGVQNDFVFHLNFGAYNCARRDLEALAGLRPLNTEEALLIKDLVIEGYSALTDSMLKKAGTRVRVPRRANDDAILPCVESIETIPKRP